ncbi:hydrogenase 4 subunit B [Methylocystis sp. MJC1]|jgi:formate hydrogenlyase subunit 3/multisubunit Na+/H+ antiporter MnhD subunit|uniref:hydrogenase 4 subunit B n=1 Tax=Methylocystis sp. MJC1 TaxID=2654282 RepID=UPI0013EE294B|nr:hydrogenase 4 subunit B [Methylocystis sp. MJC1]KAF2990003.1 Hydrogenase-4 component B [Methylocystis sp. MJC1]MBU6528793.1 hydrogenase 4 subunit B [Methylocystis sp. MJC1]UZX11678.1 hydrogenase 4 subunit B [Methylocystis sp. MJC1]
MPLYLALLCVGALVGVGVASIRFKDRADVTRLVYGLTGGLCAVIFLAVIVPRGAHALQTTLPLGLPWIGMRFRIDALSAFFLAVVNLGGAAASAYAIGYGAHEKSPMRVLPFFPAFIAGMNGVVMADDAFTFLVAWEFMSLSSWALVISHHDHAENRAAAYIYLLMASFGTLCLLMAFGVLGGATGAYDFDTIRGVPKDAWKSGLVLALVILGAGSKAGLVPLHIWLPLAHPAAPSHVSALMSGVMTKVAIYGFIRMAFDLLGPPAFWWSIHPLVFGAASALIGVLFATVQSDLKKLLAYSTIENIGIIFVALGLALAFKANGQALPAALAFTAALFHVFNHALFKSTLFFGAGAVLGATGEKNIEKLGGLIRSMPKTAFVFLGGCMAIAALPPLNGFVSEWLVFQAILLSPSLPQWILKLITPAVGVTLALSAALGAGAYVRAFGVVFLGRPRSPAAEQAQETDQWSLRAMFALISLCLLAGITPSFMIDTISPAAAEFVGGRMPAQSQIGWFTIAPIAESRSSYNGLIVFAFIGLSAFAMAQTIKTIWPRPLRRAPPWDCGYVDPTPASQYTASSFAQPVRRALGVVAFSVREKLDMPLPGETRAAHFSVEIGDRFIDYIYEPLTKAVLFCSGRLNVVNFLSIQEYVALVFAALVFLLILVAL